MIVEPAGAITIQPAAATSRDWKTYAVQGKAWGRARLTVTYQDGLVQTIHYFVTEPAAQALADMGHFLSTKQWFTDKNDPFHRAPSFMTYDREVNEIVVQDSRAWIAGLGDEGLDGGRQAARGLLNSGFCPSPILCVNDFMSVGVVRELREGGLQIRRDVSVTGFDNIKLSEFCLPPLTTVHIPREQIGHIIFDNVLGDGQNEHDSGREIVIDPELVLRDSTGPAFKS